MLISSRSRMLSAVALVLAVGCGQAVDRNVAPADITVQELHDAGTAADAVQNDTPANTQAGAEATASDEITPPSTIRTMQLTRRGALGFCIDDGQFLNAQITTGADGLLELSGQLHRGWNESEPTGCDGLACQQVEEIGPIQLDDAQLSSLEQLTEQLPEGGCPDKVNGVCDPCLVSSLTVNDVSYGGDVCTPGCWDSAEVVLEIGNVLDSWVAP